MRGEIKLSIIIAIIIILIGFTLKARFVYIMNQAEERVENAETEEEYKTALHEFYMTQHENENYNFFGDLLIFLGAISFYVCYRKVEKRKKAKIESILNKKGDRENIVEDRYGGTSPWIAVTFPLIVGLYFFLGAFGTILVLLINPADYEFPLIIGLFLAVFLIFGLKALNEAIEELKFQKKYNIKWR